MCQKNVLIGVSAAMLPPGSTVVQTDAILNSGGSLMSDAVCCCY